MIEKATEVVAAPGERVTINRYACSAFLILPAIKPHGLLALARDAKLVCGITVRSHASLVMASTARIANSMSSCVFPQPGESRTVPWG